MRINLHIMAEPRPPKGLFNSWTKVLSEEYNIKQEDAWRWFTTFEGREFIAACLRSQGWRITTYETPRDDTGLMISYGFVVADDCEQFVAWKLAEQ